ncbi:Uncharacterised protein [Serratia fonticola]|uniref:Uncharacterized protein n=1 Tax=Serratia fonticola TaxID=47917 RepID=A0A4U9WPU2_SERFO|nr:Uncharacterised protein [Serratia fonticola]
MTTWQWLNVRGAKCGAPCAIAVSLRVKLIFLTQLQIAIHRWLPLGFDELDRFINGQFSFACVIQAT